MCIHNSTTEGTSVFHIGQPASCIKKTFIPNVTARCSLVSVEVTVVFSVEVGAKSSGKYQESLCIPVIQSTHAGFQRNLSSSLLAQVPWSKNPAFVPCISNSLKRTIACGTLRTIGIPQIGAVEHAVFTDVVKTITTNGWYKPSTYGFFLIALLTL